MDGTGGKILKAKKEFKDFLTPLSEEEITTLKESLLSDGCKDALVVWKGKNILIDGHHRYKICKDNNIKFKVKEIELASDKEAIDKIIEYQFGRRNLTSEQRSYLRGILYNLQKTKHGGDRKSKYNFDTLKNTAENVSKKFQVSTSTVKKDASYAEKLDELVEEHGKSFKQEVLKPKDGEKKYTKTDISDLYAEKVEKQKEVIDRIRKGQTDSVCEVLNDITKEKYGLKRKKAKEKKEKKKRDRNKSLNNRMNAMLEDMMELTHNINRLADFIKNSNFDFSVPTSDRGHWNTVWASFKASVEKFHDAIAGQKKMEDLFLLGGHEEYIKKQKKVIKDRKVESKR